MKKIPIIILLIGLTLAACQNENELEQHSQSQKEIKDLQALEAMTQAPLSLREHINFVEFALTPDNQNWRSFDKFYRKMVSNEEYQQAEDFVQMKQELLLMIVLNLDLMEDKGEAVEAAREYYWQELQKLDFQHPEVAHVLLKERRQRIGEESAKTEASQILAKNRSTYNDIASRNEDFAASVDKFKQF